MKTKIAQHVWRTSVFFYLCSPCARWATREEKPRRKRRKAPAFLSTVLLTGQRVAGAQVGMSNILSLVWETVTALQKKQKETMCLDKVTKKKKKTNIFFYPSFLLLFVTKGRHHHPVVTWHLTPIKGYIISVVGFFSRRTSLGGLCDEGV